MKKRSIVMAMAALMMVSAVTGCTSKAEMCIRDSVPPVSEPGAGLLCGGR